MELTSTQKQSFLRSVWDYYDQHGRHALPWRLPEPDGTFDPYKILVSELMLQQTQVARVIPKYDAFLQLFPTAQRLAKASLGDVLRAWQGLGYNRRAKYLWQAAGVIASTGWPADLTELPGVGPNTAGAIRAYAWNEPAIFIETNIRTVYIHHFAPDQQDVSDACIRGLLAQTLTIPMGSGKEQPEQKSHFLPFGLRKTESLSHYREFYWALMDYGSFLKQQVHNIAQSAHYSKQSKFEGSERQLRGLIIRGLAAKNHLSRVQLVQLCQDDRLDAVLKKLLADGLIVHSTQGFRLA